MTRKKVLVFGSFDVLHDGHRSLFRQARSYGEQLFVVVARNATYHRVRGHQSVHDEQERLKVVSEEPLVDQALLGEVHDVYRVIGSVRPDVVCLGYDQEFFVDKLKAALDKFKLNIPVVRLDPHHPEKYKSSLLKKGEGYLPDI